MLSYQLPNSTQFSLFSPLHCHLMTLSALASTFGVIVRPICFAAFRLMISSNFVGCSNKQVSRLGRL